jgi:hypothetical protein
VNGCASIHFAEFQEKSGTRFESLKSGITHSRRETTENCAQLTASLAEVRTPMKEAEQQQHADLETSMVQAKEHVSAQFTKQNDTAL